MSKKDTLIKKYYQEYKEGALSRIYTKYFIKNLIMNLKKVPYQGT